MLVTYTVPLPDAVITDSASPGTTRKYSTVLAGRKASDVVAVLPEATKQSSWDTTLTTVDVKAVAVLALEVLAETVSVVPTFSA